MLAASFGRAGLRSGPGHTKRLASVSTTHERSSSKPRRRFVAAGSSTARSGSAGAEREIGSTVTTRSPSSSTDTRMTAQRPVFDALLLAAAIFGPPQIAVTDDEARNRFEEGHLAMTGSVRHQTLWMIPVPDFAPGRRYRHW